MTLTQEVYSQKARELEAEGKLREAEKMYCTIKQYDLAIGLYKQHSMWDQVIRLVSQHRKVCHKVVDGMLLFCCWPLWHCCKGIGHSALSSYSALYCLESCMHT